MSVKMGVKRTLILAVVFFLSFHVVSALEIQSYKITATPVNGNYVENIVELVVYNEKATPLTEGSLNVALDAEIQEIRDSYGNLNYVGEAQNDKQKITFSFTTPIQAGETRTITIETTTYNVEATKGHMQYLLVLVPRQDIALFTHILRLDRDVELYNLADKEKYLIAPDATVTETEEYIFIQWTTSLAKDVPTVFLTRFEQEQPIHWLEFIGIAVLILSCGVIFGIAGNKAYAAYKQKKALKATKILNEREQAVLEHIIKNNQVKQYELVKKLDYTKSNMSKILKRLEFRGLITVKKEGKVRILGLGDTLKNKI